MNISVIHSVTDLLLKHGTIQIMVIHVSIFLLLLKLIECLCKGYAVTILVEGGIGSLEVLENDIENKRPIVVIQVCILYSSLNFWYYNYWHIG